MQHNLVHGLLGC